mgnify:CR=1 FL=1
MSRYRRFPVIAKAAELSGKFGDTEGPITSVRLINGGGNKLDAFAKLGVHSRVELLARVTGTHASRQSTAVA